MEHTSPEEIKKQTKVYIGVFAALAILTVVTVLVARLDLRFTHHLQLALLIALIKGALVGAYFMHLIWEENLIKWVLLLTGFFLATVLLLPYFTQVSNIVSHVS